MIRTQYAICAERVVRDANSNTVSIFEVVEEIQSPGFPRLVPMIMAVWVLERDAGDPQQPPAALRLIHNGAELHRTDLTVDFQDVNRTRAFVRLGGLVLPGPGTLRFSFLLDGEERAFYNIEVRQVGGEGLIVQVVGAPAAPAPPGA